MKGSYPKSLLVHLSTDSALRVHLSTIGNQVTEKVANPPMEIAHNGIFRRNEVDLLMRDPKNVRSLGHSFLNRP